MAENELNVDTNTYFKQLKNQMNSKQTTSEKDSTNNKNPQIEAKAYEEKEEILKKIERTKELPAEKQLLEIEAPKNGKSSLDKLKEITEKKQIKETTTKTETKKEQFTTQNSQNQIIQEDKSSLQENFGEQKLVMDGKEKITPPIEENQKSNPFFEARKTDGEDLKWLKREIIEEPIDKDFISMEKETARWPKKNKDTNSSEESIEELNKKEELEKKEILDKKNKVQEDNLDEPKEVEEFIITDNLNEKISAKKEHYKTPIDEAFELLEAYKKVDMEELAKYIKLDYPAVEKIAKTFEEEGIVEIEYPTSLNKKPILILKNSVAPRLTKKPEGKLIEEYNLLVDKVPATISIILSREENRRVYCVEIASIGTYTKKYLDYIKTEIAESMPIELDEILDPKKAQKLKERFFEESRKKLSQHFQNLETETLDMLSGVILHEMYGLGEIEILIGDEMLEEIAINSAKTPITVYHRIYGWLKTNMLPGNEEEIMNYSSQIGRKIGREITNLNPILDAHLLSGDRVNATLSPISSEGNTITIRRFARKPWTIINFIGKAHTMNSEMAAMLWLAMQYELNILIAGGTASGKTSALNSMLALVPTYHRIISIEDVREIILPKYLEWNWIPMVTRSPNPEGLGEVTMLDLMITSLRMRPDRIIVGEIRRKKEAEVLMEAIETGHSIYSTIHANSSYQVLRRLAEPPINIPLMQIELIDLIVVQYRDRKTNKRRTYEIAEIEKTSTGQGLQVNTLYKWVPRTDSWEKLNKPTKLITLLNVHTGMTEDDINREISERKNILEWLKEINLTELNDIGYVIKMFYSYPDTIKKLAKNKTSAEEIRKMMSGERNIN